MNTKPWAMLAEDYYEQDFVRFPCIVQQKLNGVRAKWDAKEKLFISRQLKVFPRHVIPHLYDAYADEPLSLDGELYCHGMSFQDICARVAVGRNEAHPDVSRIAFHAFDVIADVPQEDRLDGVCIHYGKAGNKEELEWSLAEARKAGYEGLMIRCFGVPYMVGRTKALLKMKPLQQDVVDVIGFVEGKGKFKNMLGAFIVRNSKGVEFRVGGGNITETERMAVWHTQRMGMRTAIRYTELSKTGVPLQPKIIGL